LTLQAPPPPSKTKPVAFYDTECFPNYWVLKIRVQNGPVFSFPLRSGESFDQSSRERIEYIFSIFLVVSFNGNYYDVPVITAALSGFTCEQLKWVSDQIIVAGIKPWELGLPMEWKPADHIDVMEVLPGEGSQKQYAGRIHCKTMRDLPYDPDKVLTDSEILEVDSYCENDLSVLADLFDALAPQIAIREKMSNKYGLDLRSKSDAQMGEAIIKIGCERATGQRIYKREVDWNLRFRYEPPLFLSFQYPHTRAAFELIKNSIFGFNAAGKIDLPEGIKALRIEIGESAYQLGIGGIHSTESSLLYISDEENLLRDADVASYYPRLIVNSKMYPPALGPSFCQVYPALIDERLNWKTIQKKLEKLGVKVKDVNSGEGYESYSNNEGLKVAINGPFGKLFNFYSTLLAPEMGIYTTVTGQLSLLMLIEWLEMQAIKVISANTDGLVVFCPRSKLAIYENIIDYWQKVTNLEMEISDLRAIYSRDVNSYIVIKGDGELKRKGEFGKAGLIEKKNPDVEICADAVAEFLSKGTPILTTVTACRDIRKFVKVRQVNGGAVKLWGEGPQFKLVRDMVPTLIEKGWKKTKGHKWERDSVVTDATSAYQQCFRPQIPEYIGKVIRWYYGVNSRGTIIYNNSGDTVGLSYGAQPCMTLPDKFPLDIDYKWYVDNCEKMLRNIGYYDAHCERCGSRKRDSICQNYGCEGKYI
jgi:hypothetical protein